MRVLICDNDAVTRYSVGRMLRTSLGCTVTPSGDGAEAVRLLESEHFDLFLLDIDIRVLNGFEVIEAIRKSPKLSQLPIVILTAERQADAIKRLMTLGVRDYILKPLSSEKVAERLVPIKHLLAGPPGTATSTASGPITLGPDSPGLIVDGNPDFRHFFTSHVSSHAPIMEGDSGSAGLAAFHQTPARVVFIGRDLGIIGAGLLALKLRGLASRRVRIVGVAGPEERGSMQKPLFDDVIDRTFVSGAFRKDIQRFLAVEGSMGAATDVEPDLKGSVTSATGQIFGMMLDAAIAPAEAHSDEESFVSANIDLAVADRFVLNVGVHLTRPVGQAVAAKMFFYAPSAASEEDCLSAVGELANLIAGRLHARFGERAIPSKLHLPATGVQETLEEPTSQNGFLLRFTMSDISGFFAVSVVVKDCQRATAASSAAA